ncbi:MAG: Fic family protein [bacterium]|nr:Fic family protein [bacterium]
MMTDLELSIWQRSDWPAWRFDHAALMTPIAEATQVQGILLGRMVDIGLAERDQANWLALTDDVLGTSEIEGDRLDGAVVRSSIARRLGIDHGAIAPVDRHVEGVVELVLDATGNPMAPLTRERLFGWHAALFPTGYSGLTRIRAGSFREDHEGPMQVVSGPIGRQRVHFEAPPADRLEAEIERFLDWFEARDALQPVLRAGLAHLWFVTLHPFDDGNGRIARALGDLVLARADGLGRRFYSLSAQIQRERRVYYEMLERTQKGGMDVTPWLLWFVATWRASLEQANQVLDGVLVRNRFWNRWSGTDLNARQIKVLSRLLEGFEGKLTSRKWAAIARCSPDTALRDIQDLIGRGILRRGEGGGRSAAYELVR